MGCLATAQSCLLTIGKPHDLCVHLKRTKGLSLKEEVGQMLSDCPTASNNFNVDSLILCASRGCHESSGFQANSAQFIQRFVM
jgi:hypothetical protein